LAKKKAVVACWERLRISLLVQEMPSEMDKLLDTVPHFSALMRSTILTAIRTKVDEQAANVRDFQSKHSTFFLSFED
jgi:hypothetical protein